MYNWGMKDLGLSSRAWLLFDNSWGREVFDEEGESMSEGADTPMEVASLTKIMTAVVVLEQRSLDEEVTITEEMLTGLEEFAVIGLEAGQVATVGDLLYATMLPSAGDAAQALAVSTSGSIEKFVEVMNRRAADFGMKNTHFSNPVGFDWWEAGDRVAEGGEFSENRERDGEIRNYSTARDVALMLRKALQDERFREIFESFEKELPSIGKTARKTFGGIETIRGGKTGFTNAAGRCLASTAEIDGTEYILVTLGAEGAGHLEDAKKIYAKVESEYEQVRLAKAGDLLVRMPVEGSPVKMLEFRGAHDVTMRLPKGLRTEDLAYSFEGHKGRTVVRRDTVADEPFGGWKVEYKGNTLYNLGLTVRESCEGIAKESYCVEKPGFYHYGVMMLGGLVTVCLAGLTVREFLKARRRKKASTKDSGKVLGGVSGVSARRETGEWSTKVAPWAGLVMTVISAAICGFMLWDCFRSTPEVEVLRPEIERISSEAEVGDNSGGEVAGVEAGESGATSSSEGGAAVSGGEAVAGGNCATGFGNLMLINPNFTVDYDFIASRQAGLISVSQNYGIPEYHRAGNGDNLMVPEAAAHLSEMLKAYTAENPGHEMGTYSCFRARGTTCGRLCAATGTSDHHTGLTCDLIDLAYGSVLNTDDYWEHKEWQWLRANSYRFGFIDRFPEEWAGGPMSEPLNVDANGSTGLFETWHYRYVGVEAATEIATGKYNNGRYDSLEHYLKATGRVTDLKGGKCR